MPTHKKSRCSRVANPRQERHITVYGVQRDKPDLRKLSRAVIAMALAEAERGAQAQHETNRRPRGDGHD